MLGTRKLHSSAGLALALVLGGAGASSCGNATGPNGLPAELTVTENGPGASNTPIVPATTDASTNTLTVRAVAYVPQSGYTFSAAASWDAAGPTRLLRVVVSSRSSIGLQLFWSYRYSVIVKSIPAGTYDLILVRIDDGRNERVELRQTVQVP